MEVLNISDIVNKKSGMMPPNLIFFYLFFLHGVHKQNCERQGVDSVQMQHGGRICSAASRGLATTASARAEHHYK